MSNTVIQIKRSSTTSTPSGGSLSAAEPAYSYQSEKLFLGDAAGTGVIAVGGRFYVNQQNTIFDLANTAFNYANTISGGSNTYTNQVGAASNAWANAVGTAGNNYTNFVGVAGNNFTISVGLAGNNYTNFVGVAGNNYTDSVGAAGNSYAQQVGQAANNFADTTYYKKSGGTISGDVVVTGNLTISGMTTYANTQHLQIGDAIFTLNADLPASIAPSENAGMEVNRGSSANAYLIWDESSDKWTFNEGGIYYNIASNTSVESVAISANAYALATATSIGTAGNNYTNSVGVAGNNYTNAVGTAGNNYTDLVGASSNAFATAIGTAGNNYTNSVGVAGNNYTNSVGVSSNAWATAVGIAGNNYTDSVGVAGNNYTNYIGGLANTNAANGSYISTGVVAVSYGGTGNTTFTTNGILFGNGTGPVQVTAAGTDGQVLQSDQGVPKFAMLDGGTF
jgi:hypothetical protein